MIATTFFLLLLPACEGFTGALSSRKNDAFITSQNRNMHVNSNKQMSQVSASSKFGPLFSEKASCKNTKIFNSMEMSNQMIEKAYQRQRRSFRTRAQRFLVKGGKQRSLAVSLFAFFSIWNLDKNLYEVHGSTKVAHAKSHTKIPDSGTKPTSPASESKSTTFSSGAVAVCSSAAGVVLGKNILKSTKSNKKMEDSDENEKKFNEVMGGTAFEDPPLVQTSKVQSIEEESIKKTEEAEHESFKLAAAKKAAADAVNKKRDEIEKEPEVAKVSVALKENDMNIDNDVKTEEKTAEDSDHTKDTIDNAHNLQYEEMTIEITTEHIKDEITDEPQLAVEVFKEEITKEEQVAKARQQPKTSEEEEALSEKYSSLSMEERAFTILLDLGMIELTPDPDDPSYDNSVDDEFCSENKLE